MENPPGSNRNRDRYRDGGSLPLLPLAGTQPPPSLLSLEAVPYQPDAELDTDIARHGGRLCFLLLHPSLQHWACLLFMIINIGAEGR